ncbi:MAG: DegT/DnrJ/EryC1/StrS family aminotransferase [Gammaproteobacteria bacterium]|nr:DegT/DnrJ/EryC1/StrS family aminotransferase [Gammaproteobacteria bacterium]
MKIPFSALDKQHLKLLPELLPCIEDVLRSAHFVLGKPVQAFEENFANYHQCAHAIGVNSGTDALILALRALNIDHGDEVITTANTFITTVSSIALVGATPILVDIGNDDNINVDLIEAHITEKTKAILPVHWTGRPCDMERICNIAKKYNLRIIEDCAQAISAKYKGQLISTFGDIGCFSLHPYKTLNACGDAGIIVTDDDNIANQLRALRQNGLDSNGVCNVWSNNSRLDTMQAAILNVKLNYFANWTERRIEIARYYTEQLKSIPGIQTPATNNDQYHSVFHVYIIKANNRDALKQYLQDCDIETRIHYQTPIYKQPIALKTLPCTTCDFPRMEQVSKQALSLPIYPELNREQQDYIISKVKAFYAQNETYNQNSAAIKNAAL